MRDDDALDLVEKAYAAAETPALWDDFLLRLGDLLRATSIGLFYQDLRTSDATIGANVRADPSWTQKYVEHYAAINPVIRSRRCAISERSVLTSQMMIDDDELRRHEYYADWLQPQDLFHAVNVCLFRQENIVANLVAFRPERDEPFATEDVVMLHRIEPHVRRALRLYERIDRVEQEFDDLRSLLDRLNVAAIVTDPASRVLYANRAADDLLLRRDGIASSPHGLELSTIGATAELRKIVARCCTESEANESELLLAPRVTDRAPLQLFVFPLRRPRQLLGRASALVIVADPEAPADVDAMRDLFGLTPAEARLAAKLRDGLSLHDA